MNLLFIFLPFGLGVALNLSRNLLHLGCCHNLLTLLAGCILLGSKTLCLSMTIDKILEQLFQIKSNPTPLSFISLFIVSRII